MVVAGNWLKWKWDKAQGRLASELGAKPGRPVLCSVPKVDVSKGLCHLLQGALWAV